MTITTEKFYLPILTLTLTTFPRERRVSFAGGSKGGDFLFRGGTFRAEGLSDRASTQYQTGKQQIGR